MRRALLFSIALVLSSPAGASDGAVRALASAGGVSWAVGDRGLIVRSDDGGKTWRTIDSKTDTSFRAAHFADAKTGWVFGGRILCGRPGGAGVGVILATADGGKTFRPVNAAGLGFLNGGRMEKSRGVAFGRPTGRCPSGVWITVTAGKLWVPVKTASRGAVRGGGFWDINTAYLVGGAHRIVSLRRLAEPPIRPEAISSDAALTAATYAAEETCWAVGENGSVLLSAPTGRPWRSVTLPLPAGTRRLADLGAVAADEKNVYLAGGLTGTIFRAPKAGGPIKRLSAPGPGPVRALLAAGDGVVLAAGDAGRIWRSADAGATWARVRGPAATDVLFVAGPADVSVLPAVVAHAHAGAVVAVVYAARPPDTDPLLAECASAALAGGATVLSDFDAVAGDPDAEALDRDAILKRYARRLDAPARDEMVRQIAAAIRLYRPQVVAVGPAGHGAKGAAEESHLIAELAAEAFKRAADEKSLPELARAGLAPHAPKRFFIGLDDNARPQGLADPPRPVNTGNYAVRLIGWHYPADAETSLTMMAMRAAWRLPWVGLADRPAEVTAYRAAEPMTPKPLMTSGLAQAQLDWQQPTPIGDGLASGATIRALAAMKRPLSSAAPALLNAAKARPADAVPPDMLVRLACDQLAAGRLADARATLRAVVTDGRGHPLFERLNVDAAARAFSAEWSIQAASALGAPADGADRKRLLTALTGPAWRAWADEPAARAMIAKAREKLARATGKAAALKPVAAAYEALARAADDRAWRQFAVDEMRILAEPSAAPPGAAVAARAAGEPKIDGRTDETFWAAAKVLPLTAARVDPPAGVPKDLPAATVRLAGAPSGLAVAIHLGGGARQTEAPRRDWRLTLAVDGDRDGWTQLVLSADTQGRQAVSLRSRFLPPAALKPSAVPIQARHAADGWTVETFWPYELLGIRTGHTPFVRGQVILTVRTPTGHVAYDLARQPDGRLGPHRYRLIALPAPPAKP